MITFQSKSPEQTEEIGRALGEAARKGLYLALCGELGGGKTTFVRGLALGLGSKDNVTSPTFVLMREYQGRLRLFHADFYRLDNASDLTGLDLEDCLRQGVLAVEWADKFALPDGFSAIVINFEWQEENQRDITLRDAGGAGEIIIEFSKAVERR